jgi:hypothetical protein
MCQNATPFHELTRYDVLDGSIHSDNLTQKLGPILVPLAPSCLSQLYSVVKEEGTVVPVYRYRVQGELLQSHKMDTYQHTE